MPDDLYSLLGLHSDASPEEIRRAFFEAARRLHPDVNKSPGQTEIFLNVKTAYEVLSDSLRRRAYDESLELSQTGSVSTKGISKQGVPEGQFPLNVEISYSRPTLTVIDEAQLVYALIEIKPGTISVPSLSPPLNLCLVLDRSTSMQGERMDTLKVAAIELIRQLKPDDVLSIVVFSDRADVLQPASRRPTRTDLETQIRMLQTSGGTEIYQGLQAGMTEVRRSLSRTRLNHLILLTDGRTYGDEEACLQLAERATSQGISITAMGIGGEWNDTFLDGLANRTGGKSLYVRRASDIKNYLQEKFTEFGTVFADQVSLQLDSSNGVQLRYAFRLLPDPLPLIAQSMLPLGSLPREARLQILLEYEISPFLPGIQECSLALGKLAFELPMQTTAPTTLPISLSLPVGGRAVSRPVPPSVYEAVQYITLYRLQERALTEAAEGNLSLATHHLELLARQLLVQGRHELAHTVLVEADRLKKTQNLSQDGGKLIKYGTRGLFTLPGMITNKP